MIKKWKKLEVFRIDKKCFQNAFGMILNWFEVILVIVRSSVGRKSVVGRSSICRGSVVSRRLIVDRFVVDRLSIGCQLLSVGHQSVVGRHALRVSPAVTRLTVYRRLQVRNTRAWRPPVARTYSWFSEGFLRKVWFFWHKHIFLRFYVSQTHQC